MPDSLNFNFSDLLDQAREFVHSRELIELLSLQLAIIAGAFALAWGLRVVTRSLTDPIAARLGAYLRAGRLGSRPHLIGRLLYAWLILVIAGRIAARFGYDLRLVGIAADLTALWLVLLVSTSLLGNAPLARIVAIAAWIIVALDITGLLGPASAVLDSAALTIGTMRLSLLLVIKAALILAVLLWAALALARLIGGRIQHLASISPSVQTLISSLVRIALVSLALLIGLNAVGIDLTTLAVFSGAIGVGLGFGLQKIVSNFVCGIILLVEESIKPGDVIELGHTHGTVTALGARYASVRSRDGKEYLIPNESLITNQVINWSYSSPLLRLDLKFGVGYGSDMRQVRQLAIDAAKQTKRVLETPPPLCHITEFGDNGVNLLLRFWISDPSNGVTNITGDVYLALWDALQEHSVELPYPQRDLHIRDLPAALMRETREAAE